MPSEVQRFSILERKYDYFGIRFRQVCYLVYFVYYAGLQWLSSSTCFRTPIGYFCIAILLCVPLVRFGCFRLPENSTKTRACISVTGNVVFTILGLVGILFFTFINDPIYKNTDGKLNTTTAPIVQDDNKNESSCSFLVRFEHRINFNLEMDDRLFCQTLLGFGPALFILDLAYYAGIISWIIRITHKFFLSSSGGLLKKIVCLIFYVEFTVLLPLFGTLFLVLTQYQRFLPLSMVTTGIIILHCLSILVQFSSKEKLKVIYAVMGSIPVGSMLLTGVVGAFLYYYMRTADSLDPCPVYLRTGNWTLSDGVSDFGPDWELWILFDTLYSLQYTIFMMISFDNSYLQGEKFKKKLLRLVGIIVIIPLIPILLALTVLVLALGIIGLFGLVFARCLQCCCNSSRNVSGTNVDGTNRLPLIPYFNTNPTPAQAPSYTYNSNQFGSFVTDHMAGTTRPVW